MPKKNRNNKNQKTRNTQPNDKKSFQKFDVDPEEREKFETFKLLNEIFENPQIYDIEPDRDYHYNILSLDFLRHWEDFINGKTDKISQRTPNLDLLDKYVAVQDMYLYKLPAHQHLNYILKSDIKLHRDFVLCSSDAWGIVEARFGGYGLVRKFYTQDNRFRWNDSSDCLNVVMVKDLGDCKVSELKVII